LSTLMVVPVAALAARSRLDLLGSLRTAEDRSPGSIDAAISDYAGDSTGPAGFLIRLSISVRTPGQPRNSSLATSFAFFGNVSWQPKEPLLEASFAEDWQCDVVG
jgi:hypothetical protein